MLVFHGTKKINNMNFYDLSTIWRPSNGDGLLYYEKRPKLEHVYEKKLYF